MPIFLIILASIAMIVSGLSLTSILNAASSKDATRIMNAVSLVLVIWFITLAIGAIKEKEIAQAVKILDEDLKEKILTHISEMKITDFHKIETGKYVSWLTNDLTTLENNYFTVFFKLISNVFLVYFSFGALVMIHPIIALTSLLLLFLMIFPSKFFQKKLTPLSEQVSKNQELFTQIASDKLNGFHVFYHLDTLKNLVDSIMTSSLALETSKVDLKKKTAIISSVIVFCSIFSQCILLGVTTYLYSIGAVAIGIILSIGNIGGTFFNAVNAFTSSYTLFKSMNAFIKKFDFTPAESMEDEGATVCDEIKEISLHEVSFSYGNKQILDNFNYTFSKHKKYLLFGESGKGKSTILKLLIGDIQPSAGQVYINQDILPSSQLLRNKIGYIDQEPYIFNLSIKDNLLLGEHYSNEEIMRSLDKVGLADFVNALDGKLDYIISDHGKNLSGGQKQRLAIARCLLRKQELLLVDECTSALDESNAQKIEDLLLTDNTLTILMVAHHVSNQTQAYFDEVIHL